MEINSNYMKPVFLVGILSLMISGARAQNIQTDSVETGNANRKGLKFSVSYTKDKKDSTSTPTSNPGFSFKVTFARLDLGFTKLVDNNSFSLSPANEFLQNKAWKTHNIGFDLVQFGYRFSSHFKVYLSGGFDWNHIQLTDQITIQRDQPTLNYTVDTVDYSKNRFTSSYLRIPLSFEFRSKDDNDGNKFHFVFGPEAGFFINGRVKQVSETNGKQKFDDHYHFTQFRYGAFARVGYNGSGLYAKYYFNDMFENSPAQAGINNMSFGLMLGF
jgi:hypothetical protein